MAILDVEDADFDNIVLKSDKFVLCDFWAEWCAPCKQITPILEDISNEFSDNVLVTKINIDNNPEIPTKFNIRGIPTLILFNKGIVNEVKTGLMTKTEISEWLNSKL